MPVIPGAADPTTEPFSDTIRGTAPADILLAD